MFLRLMLGAVALVGVAIADGGAASAFARPSYTPGYIALGGSTAYGSGASVTDNSYVPQFAQFLQSKEGLKRDIQVTNLALPYAGALGVAGESFAAAAVIAEANADRSKKNDVRLLTLDTAAADDLITRILVCADGLTPGCLAAGQDLAGTYAVVLNDALNMIRSADSDLPIVVMTAHNPSLKPSCEVNFLVPVWDAFLEGHPALGIERGLNDITRELAARYGAETVETYGLLTGDDFADCLSPNDLGHSKIAGALISAFDKHLK